MSPRFSRLCFARYAAATLTAEGRPHTAEHRPRNPGDDFPFVVVAIRE